MIVIHACLSLFLSPRVCLASKLRCSRFQERVNDDKIIFDRGTVFTTKPSVFTNDRLNDYSANDRSDHEYSSKANGEYEFRYGPSENVDIRQQWEAHFIHLLSAALFLMRRTKTEQRVVAQRDEACRAWRVRGAQWSTDIRDSRLFPAYCERCE